MKDKIFLDTNILIYLYSNDDLIKKNIALRITEQESLYTSTQVLIEFANIAHRKLHISFELINKVVEELENNFEVHLNSIMTIKKAISIANRYQYTWFDSLIISAALESGCNILYSEDMHHQHFIENSLTIINPFL